MTGRTDGGYIDFIDITKAFKLHCASKSKYFEFSSLLTCKQLGVRCVDGFHKMEREREREREGERERGGGGEGG